MNKQIEEISYSIYNNEWVDISCYEADKIAEMLIKQGYQKIDKDKQVVLTKEEYDNLKLEIQKAHNKGVRVGFDLTKFKQNSIEKTRKETASEILDQIKFLVEERNGADIEDLSVAGTILEEILNELAKQYGVEIKE